jgi:pimeloyl-ACP methyl ester carboxylesterase
MTTEQAAAPELVTISARGARVQYGIRGDLGWPSEITPLMIVGSPMDSLGFQTLASYFTDRPVITYDPRGTGGSRRTHKKPESTPLEHADDLRRVIADLGAGPVDLFASSGGAVNGLALVQQHPGMVATLIAHEPPNYTTLPDREQVRAAVEDIQQTYAQHGTGPAMAKFIAMTGQRGEFAPDHAIPDPGPAVFGLPTTDDGSRDDPLLGQNFGSSSAFEFDFDSLRAAQTRIVLAAGAESAGTVAARSAVAIADQLGAEFVEFPSHHAGFLGGEYGQRGEPAEFAAKLAEVLRT